MLTFAGQLVLTKPFNYFPSSTGQAEKITLKSISLEHLSVYVKNPHETRFFMRPELVNFSCQDLNQNIVLSKIKFSRNFNSFWKDVFSSTFYFYFSVLQTFLFWCEILTVVKLLFAQSAFVKLSLNAETFSSEIPIY